MASLRIAVETRVDSSSADPAGEWWSKSPNSIFRDPAIPDAEKVVLQAIVTLCKGSPTCQATNGTIGKESGKNEKTIGRLVMRLESRQLIVRETVGSRRTIRLNFSFRGRASDPLRSEEVKEESTPSEVRRHPLGSEEAPPQKRGGTPAPVRTILRLNLEEEDKSSSERRSGTEGGLAAPPPPPDEAAREGESLLIPSPFPLPTAESVHPDIARFLPREIPSGIMRAGQRSISRSPASNFYPLPLSGGDLLSQDDALAAKQLLNSLDPESSDHMLMRIVIRRHNAAFGEVLKGKVLPPGPNVRDSPRVLDISPVFVSVEPINDEAQAKGPTSPLQKLASAPSEVPLDTIQSNIAPDQVN